MLISDSLKNNFKHETIIPLHYHIQGRYLFQNWNLAISISKADLYSINAQSDFGEKPLIFTEVIVRKRNSGRVAGK